MIVLYSIGGLGNQMSQMAFAIALAEKTNEKIYVDSSSFRKYKIRPFSILNMDVKNEVKDYDELNISKIKKVFLILSRKKYHVYQKIVKQFRLEVGEKKYFKLVRKGHYYSFDSSYYGIPISNKNIKDIYGYFLAERYFRPYRNKILKCFNVSTPFSQYEKKLCDLILNTNSVAISLRLQHGYINSPTMHVCTKEYFVNSIKYIESKVDNPTYFISSDDISMAKEMNLCNNAIYIDNLKDYEIMRLLSHCKNFIISNSSFSWWGAYLSEYEDKIIVAPERWVNSKLEYTDKYYDGMIKMKS